MSVAIRHLQCNTYSLRHPQKILEYFHSNQIDIATLQEISLPIEESNNFASLCQSQNLHYVQGVHWYDCETQKIFAVGILSRYSVLDYSCLYHNGENFGPKYITSSNLIDNLEGLSSSQFSSSRGLRYSAVSTCIIQALLKINDQYLKVITTHYPVSDNCIEFPAMYELSHQIKSLVTHGSNLPIIFSGDLNIRTQSYSVRELSEVLTCHSGNLSDTLSDSHPVRNRDFPSGLAVDHVFSRGLIHHQTAANQVDFSDHKMVISHFSF